MLTRRTILFSLGLLAVSSLWFRAAAAQTYVVPSTVFSGPVAPPLTSSATDQRKIGSLGIGTTTSPQKFCLNATSTTDAANCISSWSSLSSQFGGPFVSLSRNGFDFASSSVTCGLTTPQSLCVSDYTLQSGFVHLKASSTTTPQQGFTTVVQDSDLNMCSYDRTSGDQAPGYCNYGPNQMSFCYTNADCGFVSTAVYASDSGSAANAAGYFSGVVSITPPTNDPGLGPRGRICLNGTVESGVNDPPGGVCIQSWNEIYSASGGLYVQRQSGNPPATTQLLGAAISGVISLGSATAGNPAGLPAAFTCGDGLCSSNETSATCPLDCNGVPSPSFSATLSGGFVDMVLSTKPQQPAGNVGVLIVRTASASSTFYPVNGVSYSVGQVIGNATVVYAGTAPQNSTISPHPNDTLPGSGTYSYRAFQSNSFPVYSSTPADSSLGQVFRLTLTFSPNKGSFSDDNNSINCFVNGSSGCTALFQYGTVDTITADAVQSGYILSSYSGCDSQPTPSSCRVLMNSDRSVHATFVSGGGGGGGGGGGVITN